MQRSNEVISRIQSIQARVERPPVSGDFQSLLNDRMDDAPQDAADAPPTLSIDQGAVAMDTVPVPLYSMTRGGAVTMGTMLGGAGALQGVAAIGGIYPSSHHVPDGAVMTSNQLNDYLRFNRIEPRNGRHDRSGGRRSPGKEESPGLLVVGQRDAATGRAHRLQLPQPGDH